VAVKGSGKVAAWRRRLAGRVKHQEREGKDHVSYSDL
jgi:hypothetical protein